jgi:gliding motility-associatede transport system auxiliary component
MLKRILGLLGWLGVALVFSAVAIRFLKPEWVWYSRLAMAGLVCTLLYILSQWREMARAMQGREARYGTLAVASVLVVLAILVAINYLSSRHNKRWDLTAAKQFTLSEQTRKILQSLQKPVRIKVFASSEDFARFRERLDEFAYASPQVSVEYIDAVKRPSLANQYKVEALGTVVIEYEGRTERVTSDGEQELVNGLNKAVQGRQHKVYFVQGHGERDPDASDRPGYSTIKAALGSDNYTVEKLVLAQQKEVPADAPVLIVAGPKTDFFPPEIEMVKAYLKRGGKMFFMLDPPDRADSPELTSITALLKDWGIEVGTNVVVDVSGMGQLFGTGAEVPVAAKYNPHAITENFRLITAYPLARSVGTISGNPGGKFPQTLVETSPSSWAETDIKKLTSSGQVAREIDKGDKEGPVSLAAAVSAPAESPTPAAGAKPEEATKTAAKPDDTAKPESRIAVFGDSDFVANQWLGIPGNRDLFLNAVNWLAQQENMIAIRPRDPEDRRITLTRDQQSRIFWLTVLVIPGLILLTGIQTWWRRR